MRKRFSVTAMVVIAMMMVVPAVLAASSTVVITANDLEPSTDYTVFRAADNWSFYNDNRNPDTNMDYGVDNSLGTFVFGPETAPLGAGSAQISVEGSDRVNLATYQFRGIALEDITVLEYSTYNSSNGNNGGENRAGYLQFNVDFDGNDDWQRRLVFLPSQNGTVLQDEWQNWDAIANGNAKWRWSGGSNWPDGYVGTYRTWDSIIQTNPGVRIRVSDAWLGIRVGEPYTNGYTENIDAFKLGTSDGTTVFDFEPLIGPPTDKNDCKNGGWQEYNNPSFNNQGDCVSSVASGGKAGGKK